MNENDENKRIYFQKLFNTLLQGFKCSKDLKNEIINKYKEEGDEYYRILEYYLINYEEIINNKRKRNTKQ